MILGMSGLIVLFWFVAGGVALRYFVSNSCPLAVSGLMQLLGPIHRRHVLHVCSVGCRRWVLENISQQPIRGLTLHFPDDTIARKVNGSDAYSFAEICGCCPSQGSYDVKFLFDWYAYAVSSVWGVIWLIIAFCFFAGGVLVGLVAFKVRSYPIHGYTFG